MPKVETRRPHPIRRARQKRGLSQEALGCLVASSKAAVSKWESGKAFPEPHTAFGLKRHLKISLEDVYSSARGQA